MLKRRDGEMRHVKTARWLGLTGMLMLAFVSAKTAHAVETSVRITLDGALRIALENNATLLAKVEELRSIRAGEITAALRPNPTFGYTFSNIGGYTGPHGHLDQNQTLQGTIETAGKRQKRIELAQASSQITEFELEDVRRMVTFQVRSSYAGVVGARAKIDLAQSNLKNLDDVEKLQKLRAEKGDISQTDLFRIQSQRLSFENDLSDARLAFKTAKISLRQSVSPDRVPEEFDVIGSLAFRNFPGMSRDQMRNHAIANRPDVQAAAQGIEKAQADLTLQHAKAYPDIQPQVGVNETHDNGNYVSLGATVALPIFDRNQGEIARAGADIDRAQKLYDAARAQVIADVDSSYATARTAYDRYIMIRDNFLPKAKGARDGIQIAYEKGGASLLDYLDAQRTYRDTSKSSISALSDYIAALAQLEAAAGGPINH
jgi:cobalt-zinc-cadmium efflux system outer membrane protein